MAEIRGRMKKKQRANLVEDVMERSAYKNPGIACLLPIRILAAQRYSREELKETCIVGYIVRNLLDSSAELAL